ncbi:MAG: SH3 domain-containing protein [Patescibacteria group bacterium]|nr:SH3 domain-containing protein [Patescibacteria group bacterium]
MWKKNFVILVSLFSVFFQLSAGETNNDDGFRAVVYDKVYLRVSPDLNSKVIMTLSVPHVVKVEKIKDEIISIGENKGRWVYVDTRLLENDGTRIKGWIFDYYLADKSKFERVKNFKCNMFLYCSFGDFDFTLDIKTDGTYIMNVIGRKEKSKGRFFIYKQALIALDDSMSELDSLEISNKYYLRKDGMVCNRGAGKLGGDACAECVK